MCIAIGRTYRGVFHLCFGLGQTLDDRCFGFGAAFAKTVPEGREARWGDEYEETIEVREQPLDVCYPDGVDVKQTCCTLGRRILNSV
jgi:hypothetical protein